MATIYQVSELAGVSLATVSRVMNKNARVSDKTRDKVLAAIEQLNYRPNSMAQSLASSRSNSIGILVSELQGPFYGSMMCGIESKLRIANKHVIIAAGHSDEISEKDGIEFLISRNCDALILHVDAVSDEYLINLSKGKIPIVLINRYIKELEDSCIILDNEIGGYISGKLLLEQGHRNIAYISGPLWKSDAKNRFEGFKRALKEYDIDFPSQLLYEGTFALECGSKGITHLLQQNLPFSGLVCANDEMASGAMTSARDNHLAIPDDLSIVGFDNSISASHTYPKLTTVNYPITKMGEMAAYWVLKNIYQQKKVNVQNIFNPESVVRDSIKNLA